MGVDIEAALTVDVMEQAHDSDVDGGDVTTLIATSIREQIFEPSR
jgi:hypothetical protein